MREDRVERFEPLRGPQQETRRLVVDPGRESHPAANEVASRALELGPGIGVRNVDEFACAFDVARLKGGGRGRHGAVRTP